jgi:epoxyqueuosine reductase
MVPIAVVRALFQAEGLETFACLKPPGPLDPAPLDRLIADGLGDMGWMAETRTLRLDPLALLPTARSILVTAWNYQPERDCDDLIRARYLAGKDYHSMLRRKLGRIGEALAQHGGKPWDQRAAVDSAPVNERTLAHLAGLGWIGRNTLLISPEVGSYFFLGVLLSEAPVEEHRGPHGANRCGTCRHCEQVCPTKALVDGRVLGTRCISYLTFEHDGVIPRPLAEQFNGWWCGCDLCQEACPWNRFAPVAADARLTGSENEALLLSVDATTFDRVFAGRAVRRLGYARFRRNLLVALASLGRYRECQRILAEATPLVMDQARELGLIAKR